MTEYGCLSKILPLFRSLYYLKLVPYWQLQGMERTIYTIPSL